MVEKVWLLRHAETTAPHVLNGHESDVPLSAAGFAQAAVLADWFAPHKPTAVVSSEMIRARQTAAPIAARCGVPHELEFAFHERRIGALSGQPFTNLDGPWFDTFHAWNAGNRAFTTEGAESYEELAVRLEPAWQRTLARHPGGRVVIVAHGIVVKVLLLHLLHAGDSRRWVELGPVRNAAITGLHRNDRGEWIADPLLHIPDSIATLPQIPQPRSEA